METLQERAGLVGMRLFGWWSIPRKGWLIILTELCVIIGLAGWVVAAYINDFYFRNYVNNLAPIIVPVLGIALGITSGSAATILYLTIRKPRQAESTHVIVESSMGKIQSGRNLRHSTLRRPNAAKHAANPHRQPTELNQPAGPPGQETMPSLPPEKQEAT